MGWERDVQRGGNFGARIGRWLKRPERARRRGGEPKFAAALGAAALMGSLVSGAPAEARLTELAPDTALSRVVAVAAETLRPVESIEPFVYVSSQHGVLNLRPAAFHRQARLLGLPVWTYDQKWIVGDPERGVYALLAADDVTSYAAAQNVPLPPIPSLGAWESWGGKAVLLGLLGLALGAALAVRRKRLATAAIEPSRDALPDLTALFEELRRAEEGRAPVKALTDQRPSRAHAPEPVLRAPEPVLRARETPVEMPPMRAPRPAEKVAPRALQALSEPSPAPQKPFPPLRRPKTADRLSDAPPMPTFVRRRRAAAQRAAAMRRATDAAAAQARGSAVSTNLLQ